MIPYDLKGYRPETPCEVYDAGRCSVNRFLVDPTWTDGPFWVHSVCVAPTVCNKSPVTLPPYT